MPEFLRKLFDTSDFPARWTCGNWDPFHGWLHIISDLAIWAAYFMIPFALVYYWWKKRDEMEFPKLFWLFGAFIFSCGITHFIDAVIFYSPIYRISGVMKSITAVVSWMTVMTIIRITPMALALPGRAKLNEELEKELESKRQIQQKLIDSNRELEAYTGRVAHDLRSPLTGLVMLGSLAAESVNKGQTKVAAEQISIMLETLDRMSVSISELHIHSLVKEEDADLSPVDLGKVISIATENIAQNIAETGARFDLSTLPLVRGNETLLVHLFSNLFENAIKYRTDRVPEISVNSRTEGGHVVITVSDNGRGIPENEVERIFESKYRASNVDSVAGSGIGLSLCASIMEGHNGTIRAVPVSGSGAVIEMRFPLVEV